MNLLLSLIICLLSLFVTMCLLIQKQCRKHCLQSCNQQLKVLHKFAQVCKLSCYERMDRQTDRIHILYVYVGLAQARLNNAI